MERSFLRSRLKLYLRHRLSTFRAFAQSDRPSAWYFLSGIGGGERRSDKHSEYAPLQPNHATLQRLARDVVISVCIAAEWLELELV